MAWFIKLTDLHSYDGIESEVLIRVEEIQTVLQTPNGFTRIELRSGKEVKVKETVKEITSLSHVEI